MVRGSGTGVLESKGLIIKLLEMLIGLSYLPEFFFVDKKLFTDRFLFQLHRKLYQRHFLLPPKWYSIRNKALRQFTRPSQGDY